MRVTQNFIMRMAQEGVERVRSNSADAGRRMSTGIRVEKPSQDPASWADGARTRARLAVTRGRESAIRNSIDHLRETELSIQSIGGSLAEAFVLATDMANGTQDSVNRSIAADQIKTLRGNVFASANAKTARGEYVLAGVLSLTEPFDSTGFVGSTDGRTVEYGEGQRIDSTVEGQFLTDTAGVDVLGSLDALEAALRANDQDGIRVGMGNLQTAIEQVATAQSEVGRRVHALEIADTDREALEVHLREAYASFIEADPIEAASDLAQSKFALESARTVSEQLMAIATGR